MPSLEARRGEKEALPLHGQRALSSVGRSYSTAGSLLRDIIQRSAASTMVRGLHSVFRKFTKSCFCWFVKPILKRCS
jgi:hypothetical protein